MEYQDEFDNACDYHSNAILGCPYDMAEEILNDADMLDTFQLHVFNRVLSEAMASVGLKLRFDHLDRNERQQIFTIEICKRVYDDICSQFASGVLKDFIALDVVMNQLNKLDCKIYLRGIEILNQ